MFRGPAPLPLSIDALRALNVLFNFYGGVVCISVQWASVHNSSAFVYNSLTRRSGVLKRAVFFSSLKVLDSRRRFKFCHHRFHYANTSTVAKVRWKTSAGGHNQQAHTYTFTRKHQANIYRTVG